LDSEAVRAGADGYVLKLSLVQELLDAIRGGASRRVSLPLNYLEHPF
jgi:hypothetical protein